MVKVLFMIFVMACAIGMLYVLWNDAVDIVTKIVACLIPIILIGGFYFIITLPMPNDDTVNVSHEGIEHGYKIEKQTPI